MAKISQEEKAAKLAAKAAAKEAKEAAKAVEKQTEIDSWAKEHKLKVIDPEEMVIHNILPGILVSTYCRMRGGRHTTRSNVETLRGPSGERIEKWDSKRIVEDEDELKKADALLKRILRSIDKLGVKTAVGLIIPAYRKGELAQALSYGHAQTNNFNASSKTMDLIFRYGLYNIEGNSSGTIAAVTEQLGDILDKVNQSALAGDAEILQHATPGQLGDYKTAQAVLSQASKTERMLIVSKVRAAMARKAIEEVKNFSTLLPEEAGLAVTDMVGVLRKTANSWVKGAKEGDEAYEKALNSFDADGVGAFQAALVKAAALADKKAQDEIESELPPDIAPLNLPVNIVQANPEELQMASGADFIGADLFNNNPQDN